MKREIYELGEIPDLGEVPRTMYAQVIRENRFGEPASAYRMEIVPVPEIGPRDVLVYVMAAGVNYNGVWSALGAPVNVIDARRRRGEREDFHVAGSDASGIVWAVGKEVTTVSVGDEVVLHCATWDEDDPHVVAGKDPMMAPSQLIWGFETNWGSFAQFTRVQAHQCIPKPPHVSWEDSAAYMLSAATAYRMLHGWPPNDVKPGDPVLVWGAAGGLGCMAIQIAKVAGALPVAVVSGADKAAYCRSLGAVGVIDRNRFTHFGALGSVEDKAAYASFLKGAREFGAAFWEAIGKRRNPAIVIEHPGEDTLPTSMFVCDTGGMVVICAGTTGYLGSLDLRYLWMRQKRLQGSHFANDEQALAVTNLVAEGLLSPCLSSVFDLHETGHCHQLMRDNRHPNGKMAILVNARRRGCTSWRSAAERAVRPS
ncbi:crotonyl-CoA carboxylase/reductase [Polyangium sp. 15x6]|uniref:crotonyl-CoA carboxylase/reductase n=1 Tax=Polyangium sp. 15x6 TaxID=3042687 RepID=UPI00249CC29E|nr:crotonyl-CoA carboxylase/reductase [Polyangium sp. 15x6]MDI3284206.1 crotonyl-CoA carboxylase/reductase [Polyangium sp. 15x6]